MPREVLVRGGYVVTVDAIVGDLEGSDVLIQDNKIAAIGRNLSTSSQDTEVIDASGRLVIPGLVDTHRHVWQGAILAFTPQVTGAGYDPLVLNGIAPEYSPEDIYAGALWGALQALDAAVNQSSPGLPIALVHLAALVALFGALARVGLRRLD